MAGERTEEATPKKRADTRRKGQVGRSQDLSGVLVLLGGLLLLRFTGPRMISGLADAMTGAFSNIDQVTLTPSNVAGNDTHVMVFTLGLLLPLLFGIALVSIAVNILQTGPLISIDPLKPKLNRISPLGGAKRILSKNSLVALARNLMKLTIVGGVLAVALYARLNEFTTLGMDSPGASASRFAALAFEVVIIGTAALLLLGLLDLLWQRHHHSQQIRMTKQEVRDEMKQSEGNPQIKGRMREMRRDFFNRMMASVPSADVVITNPTHVAVALRYDPLQHNAPVVVAKGQRLVAQKIKDIASDNNIPMWEDRALARALYAGSVVGKPIPADLFQAVAEVLAFIFRLRAGLPARAPARQRELAVGA